MSSVVSVLPHRYVPDGNSGSGGFSDVLFCNDSHLQRKVAVKSIRDPAELARLKDEVAALMKLRSKHVVQIFDVVEATDASFAIVMEFIDGPDLFNLDFQNLDSIGLLKVLWQIACGISDIHTAGVIHRDIKPNNIKLDAEGIVKIFDFGLARDVGKDANTLGFKGTIGFSAPEQFTIDQVHFSSAIDVFAFGATALFLATQDLPSELTSSMPPLAVPANSFNSELLNPYPYLINLFEQCLSFDPEARPSMSNIRDDIAKYLLLDKHQALAVINGQPHLIDKDKRSVKLGLGTIGSFELSYDGLSFSLKNAVGEIYVNNIHVTNDMHIPGACVVGIGDRSRHYSERSFVTFDVSNPEVTL